MKVYRYSRGPAGYERKHPYITQREEIMHITDFYTGQMDPHTKYPKLAPYVKAIRDKLLTKGQYMDERVSKALGYGSDKARRYIPGYLEHYERVPSPPHVMRWRMEVPGTGEPGPVYSFIEIVADVNGSRPQLP